MLDNIYKVAKKAGIDKKYIEPYTNYKAKIDLSIMDELKNNKNGKLVLVTAITPTKSGEGKTTMSIALQEGLRRRKQNSMLCLREPSLGPVFGLKGGATGGGKVTVEPSEDINLHFNGDMHALTSAINLIAAIVDNSLFQGNPLNIDKDRIVFPRALDMNERTLRKVIIGLGEKNGVQREASFTITVASELMAVFCLAKDEEDFINRVNNITVAYTLDNKRLTIKDFKISKAILKLTKQSLKPNLVQTGEHNPCLIHGGPFANIAHGCNSLIALNMALKLSDIVVTEAGFGSDLGAEKFLDILSQVGSLKPSMCVMVATIKALKLHGGESYENLALKNVEALKIGIANLRQHLENMKKYHLEVVIAFNRFASDSKEEIDYLLKWAKENNYKIAFVDSYLKGGKGALELADLVIDTLNQNKSNFKPLYNVKMPLIDKIELICKEIYHSDGVILSTIAKEKLATYEKEGFGDFYICMAKTPASFSDNDKLLNVPTNFKINIRDVSLSSGAQFIVCLTGNILTLPGLPKIPAAVKMEEE